MIANLPHINAALNLTATLLLVVGLVCIKTGREKQHGLAMMAAFVVSTAFLACYLVYHYQVGSVPFPEYPGPVIRTIYFAILIPHVVLAAFVPFLSIASIYLGLRDFRQTHRRVSKVTWPIWFFVSVTGVMVYLMLYQFYPPERSASASEVTPTEFGDTIVYTLPTAEQSDDAE